MLDAQLRPFIDPLLNTLGRLAARSGISANHATLVGLGAGLGAGAAIASQNYILGLALILVSRVLDGIDGAIARATQKSDFGGYLDIVCDFAFYVAIPVGFGLAEPGNLALALLLVASFTLTGVSFLAFAAIAAQRGLETTAYGEKSFFYSSGLAEGTETIACFVTMCLWPSAFGAVAAIYALLCIATVVQRSLAARLFFGRRETSGKANRDTSASKCAKGNDREES